MRLIELLVEKNDKSPKGRKGELASYKNYEPSQSDYDRVGKSEFLREAGELEAEGLFKVTWYDGKSEITNIKYHTDILPLLYGRLGRPLPMEEIALFTADLERRLAGVRKGWIGDYYRHLLGQLGKGTVPANLRRPDFLDCVEAIDSQTEPVYKKVFSARHLKDSKRFERNLESLVITVARNFCPETDEAMEDKDVLSQILIEDYGQELYVKGDLKVSLDGKELPLNRFLYGVPLNSQSLKRAQLLPQNLRRVVTIENKANFEMAEYEEGVLYVFSHGYFSPLEREFLVKLRLVLEAQGAEYFHSGDMDWGGVCIFRHIRERVFPELKPLCMEAERYRRYRELGYGYPLTEQGKKKLSEFKEPGLQALIDEMAREGWGIEQECFL